MSVVVDANVIVKWYVEEPDSAAAQAVAATDDLLIAPGHALAEAGHVLVARFRDGKVSEAQLPLARIAIPGTLLLVSIDSLFDQAIDIAVRASITFYDSLYVATAHRWDTVLVTADRKLINGLVGTAWQGRAVALEEWAG